MAFGRGVSSETVMPAVSATMVDGIAGPATYGELEKSVNAISVKPEEATYSVTIGGLDLTQAQALVNNYPGSVMREVLS